MNLFLSYASEQRGLAEEICHRLQAADHSVFFDREDLPAGESYDDHIRQGIEKADLFIFLVTPESVADGRYTRTELKIASRHWPSPGQRVLPVLAAPTKFSAIPSYLRALNLLQPEGNLAAELLLEVRARAQSLGASSPPSHTRAQPLQQPLGLAATAGSMASAAPAATGPVPWADAGPRYASVMLRFQRQAAGHYRVALHAASASADIGSEDTMPVVSDLQIDAAALEAQLWRGAVRVPGTVRRRGLHPAAATADARDEATDPAADAARGQHLPAAAASRATGGVLHGLLNRASLGPSLAARLRGVDPQLGHGLRLVIDTTDAPELARLPWELLYDAAREDFIGADRFRPLLRRLSVEQPMPVLAVQPPLRLLVAVAQPAGRPELAVGPELAHLDEALAGLVAEGRLHTRRLDHTTLEGLDEALLHWRPHLLHFIGHGDFDGEEGQLILESGTGDALGRQLSGRQLAVLLRSYLGSLRLVFLNSCSGAISSAHGAFSGVAQSLLRRGVPAAVAMQFALPDVQAVRLARHFYRYLAAGQPVDAALSSARAFLYADGDDVGWAAPVLYLNAPDGRLFDFGPAAVPTLPPPLPLPQPAPTLEPTRPTRHTVSVRVKASDLAAPAHGRRGLLWIGLGGAALLLVGLWQGLLLAPGKGPIDLPSTGSTPVPVVPAPAVPSPAGREPVRAEPEPMGATPGNPKAQPTRPTRPGVQPPTISGGGAPPQALARPKPAGFGPDAEGWWLQVQAGDSWWSLSQRVSGQGARWRELQEVHRIQAARRANDSRWMRAQDPYARLQAGAAFWVPLQQRDGQSGLSLKVRAGDTLSGLAQRLYGDAGQWPRLQAGNRLPDPDRLSPGQVLWVPAKR